MISCQAVRYLCRTPTKSFRLQMNCSDASISSSQPKTGIRQITAVSPQIIRAKSRATGSFSTESSKSCGPRIVSETRTEPSSPHHSTPPASLTFFTKGPSETSTVPAHHQHHQHHQDRKSV